MKLPSLAMLPLIGALAFAPSQSSAQVSITLRLGPPVVVTQYTPEAYGDWHTSYRTWQPSTLYFYNGGWYSHQVKGSRAVVVYRSQGHYFLPPQDQGWQHKDKRYNYHRAPNAEQYQHAAPPPHDNGRGRGRGRP